MSKLKVLPHRSASASSVDWGPWSVALSGASPRPVEELLEDWDYRSEMEFSLGVEVDFDRLIVETGLNPESGIVVVTLVDCKATNRRFNAARPVIPGAGPVRVNLKVPAGSVADEVVISAHVVLGHAEGAPRPGVAHRPGSRLVGGTNHRLILEGDGARFPTDAASFKSLGIPGSMWSLSTRAESLASMFNASTRLWVNTDIPGTAELLMQDRDTRLQRFLQIDIARHLLGAAASLTSEAEDLEDGWEEGSLGDVVSNLAESTLRRDLPSLIELVRTDPQRLEGLLQECYRPWEVDDEGLSETV